VPVELTGGRGGGVRLGKHWVLRPCEFDLLRRSSICCRSCISRNQHHAIQMQKPTAISANCSPLFTFPINGALNSRVTGSRNRCDMSVKFIPPCDLDGNKVWEISSNGPLSDARLRIASTHQKEVRTLVYGAVHTNLLRVSVRNSLRLNYREPSATNPCRYTGYLLLTGTIAH